MSSLLSLRLRRFAALGPIAALAVAVLLAPTAADATPFVVKLTQQWPNVVVTGSGAFDLTGLSFFCASCGTVFAESINPSNSFFGIGAANNPPDNQDIYIGNFSGPNGFGAGLDARTTLGSGSTVLFDPFNWSGYPFGPSLWVPGGYVSDSSLSNTTTWASTTFASLGVTPGTYKWTWGTGSDQSFTLDIVKSVPEPAAAGMFGLGLLLISGFVGLRRRVA